MISGYKANKQKYQSIIHKINNLSIEEDLKKKIIGAIERYKISISCMEESEVDSLVEKCVEAKSSTPMQSELRYILTGRRKSLDDNDSKISKKDIEDEYYLD